MYIQINGIELHVVLSGAGLPLLLLHGFTGSAASWEALLPQLATRQRIIAPDLIGHGHSAVPADTTRYTMPHCVADLLALLDVLQIEQVAVLGYSMGGRVALHLAMAAPQRVRALILESASPGPDDPNERAARIQSDAALADSIERDGIAAFVTAWEKLPLFASQSTLPTAVQDHRRKQRLQNRALGLANSLRGMGAAQPEPLWEHLNSLTIPTLLLVGELDVKYCAIAQRMAAQLPAARLVVVPAAGHTIHLEQPETFITLTQEFLQSYTTIDGGNP